MLIVIGGVLGWLASIVTRAEDRQDMLTNVAVGTVGALVGGLLSNKGSLVEGISAVSLLVAFAGSIAALVLAGLLRNRQHG